MNKIVQFEDLGRSDYQETWDYQEKLFAGLLDIKSKNNKSGSDKIQTTNHLLFVEHPHVYTLGKSGSENNLLLGFTEMNKIDATFVKTNRGGDITYHGPGQIVAYPIIDLENFEIGIREYIFKLEEVIIHTLQEYNITAGRLDGAAGVWLDADNSKARKICAIGVRSSRHITMHGFAFNINTDLNYFGYINPCGFTDKTATSLEKELGQKQDIDKVKSILLEKFTEVFGMEINPKN